MDLRDIIPRLRRLGWTTAGIIGLITLATSSFFVTFAAVELSAPGYQIFQALLTGLLVSFGIFGAGGGVLFWRALYGNRKSHKQLLEREREDRLLELAEDMNGRITVTEAALESPYTVEDAREQLEEFVDKGVAEPGVSEQGREVYVFPEFRDERDKLTAETPLGS